MFEVAGTRKTFGSVFDPLLGSRSEAARTDDAPAVAMADIEAELARDVLLRITFPPAIEARYEASTKAARILNTRLTVGIGILTYLAYCFVVPALFPDLGCLPILSVLFVIVPAGLFLMVTIERMPPAFREAYMACAMSGSMLVWIAWIGVSTAPLAPYGMFPALLSNIFGNIIVRLRFHWACGFTALSVASVGLLLVVRSDLPGALAAALMSATVNGSCFGLMANNQLERTERRSFLLALRESLRLQQLNADKAALSVLSMVDALTGLSNRRAFDLRLADLQTTRRIQGRTDALLMIDVDHFKRFNDRYGHPAGDACLARVARELEAGVVRRNDLVARYGGEEFAVLLTDCDRLDAVRIAERLCRAVEAAAIPHADRGDALSVVTVSVGVACAAPGTEADALVAAADHHLYDAKRGGRNRVATSL